MGLASMWPHCMGLYLQWLERHLQYHSQVNPNRLLLLIPKMLECNILATSETSYIDWSFWFQTLEWQLTKQLGSHVQSIHLLSHPESWSVLSLAHFSYFEQGVLDIYNCPMVAISNSQFSHNIPAAIFKSVPFRGHSPALSIGRLEQYTLCPGSSYCWRGRERVAGGGREDVGMGVIYAPLWQAIEQRGKSLRIQDSVPLATPTCRICMHITGIAEPCPHYVMTVSIFFLVCDGGIGPDLCLQVISTSGLRVNPDSS